MTSVIISNNTVGGFIGDYSGTEDVELESINPTLNYGGSNLMQITKYATGNHVMGLIRFTGLSNLPASISVSSAVIGLYLKQTGTVVVTQTLTFKRLLVNWTENTLNGAAGDASWNNYAASSPWTTPGGLSDGSDRSATVSDTMAAGDTIDVYHTTSDAAQIHTDIESIQAGTYVNNGWHIERTDALDDNDYRKYASKDAYATDDGKLPYLAITYTATTSTPFAGTAAPEYKTTAYIPTTIIAGPFHVSEFLKSAPTNGGILRTNLTGLHLAWYDADPATGASPVTETITGTTDSNGLMYFAITGTTLVSGQTGYLLISDPTNGWYAYAALTVKNYFEA